MHALLSQPELIAAVLLCKGVRNEANPSRFCRQGTVSFPRGRKSFRLEVWRGRAVDRSDAATYRVNSCLRWGGLHPIMSYCMGFSGLTALAAHGIVSKRQTVEWSSRLVQAFVEMSKSFCICGTEQGMHSRLVANASH